MKAPKNTSPLKPTTSAASPSTNSSAVSKKSKKTARTSAIATVTGTATGLNATAIGSGTVIGIGNVNVNAINRGMAIITSLPVARLRLTLTRMTESAPLLSGTVNTVLAASPAGIGTMTATVSAIASGIVIGIVIGLSGVQAGIPTAVRGIAMIAEEVASRVTMSGSAGNVRKREKGSISDLERLKMIDAANAGREV